MPHSLLLASLIVVLVAVPFANRAAAHHGLDEAPAFHRGRAGDKPAAKKMPARELGTKVIIELFQVVLLDKESLRYLRRSAPLEGRSPDAVLAELQRGEGQAAGFLAGVPAIVHSTSWRYEDGSTIVLTYLAYAEELAASTSSHQNARTLLVKDLPGVGSTDPDRPRPPVLRQEDVLAHGLRHLALLARRKGGEKFVARLGERSRKFFGSIEPELAGEIGGSNMAVPSPKGAR
jgi:hypothetical protein